MDHLNSVAMKSQSTVESLSPDIRMVKVLFLTKQYIYHIWIIDIQMTMLKESGCGYFNMAYKFPLRRKEGLFPKMLKMSSEGVPQLSALFGNSLC